MTETNATLNIEIKSTGSQAAQASLVNLAATAGRTERSVSGSMAKMVVSAAAATVGFAALAKGFSAVAENSLKLEKIDATLRAVTGSAEKANSVWSELTVVQNKTGESVAELATSYNKLVVAGIKPTGEAMTSFVAFSKLSQKSVDDLAEALKDARTGEFERLKEFGITASKSGDQLSLSFQGVTTKIQNTGAAIQDYVEKLGNSKMAQEALANQLDTVGGKWDIITNKAAQFFNIKGDSPLAKAIKGIEDQIISLLDELNRRGYSGKTTSEPLTSKNILEGILTSMEGGVIGAAGAAGAVSAGLGVGTGVALLPFAGLGLGAVVGGLNASQEDTLGPWQKTKNSLSALGIGGLADFRAPSREDRFDIRGMEPLPPRGPTIPSMSSLSDGIPTESSWDETDFQKKLGDLSALREKVRTDREKIIADFNEGVATLKASASPGMAGYEEIYTRLIDKRDEALKQLDDAAARDAKAKEDELRRNQEQAERLIEQERQKWERVQKLVEEAQRRSTEAFNNLSDGMASPEEKIKNQYEERLRIIEEATEVEVNLRESAAAKAKELYDRDLENFRKSERQKQDSLYDGLRTDWENIQKNYEDRAQVVTESTEVTETERNDLMSRLGQERLDKENAYYAQGLGFASQTFGGMTEAAKNWAGESSGVYKGLFAVSKAFSLAQGAVSLATGGLRAMELPFPQNIMEGLRVAAQGAGLIAQISSANFAGAFDKGGVIPAGKIGLVGEYGPEFIQGPATVTSRKDTAAMARGNQGVTLKIVNAPDERGARKYLNSREGERMVINLMSRNSTEIRSYLR